MRLVTLFLIAAFAVDTLDAASYQQRSGTIVDPILHNYYGTPHLYSGVNLHPHADLTSATLTYAELWGVDLTGANLKRARMVYANLTGASLYDANGPGPRGSVGSEPDRREPDWLKSHSRRVLVGRHLGRRLLLH
jgi:hypothetical protein